MKILSYNVALLPNVARIQRRGDSAKEQNSRAEQIAKYINESDFDIVCLQEVFDEDDRKILVDKINREKYKSGNSVYKVSDNDLLHEDSGLFVVSKYELKGSYYEEFHDATGWEALADKGILGLHFKDDKWGIDMFIINTHLQSDIVNSKVRESQLQQIRRFISRLLAKHKNLIDNEKVELYLVGDFNVIGECCEYEKMLSYLGYPIDAYRYCNEGDSGFTWDGKNNRLIQKWDPFDKDQQRLDYIFQYPVFNYDERQKPYKLINVDFDCQIVKPQNADGEDLSDHYGVVLITS